MKENPQDLSKGTNDDSSSLIGEAQKDIHPSNQISQEKEDYCSYIRREIKMPPFLTEEEIDQIINIQTTSKTSYDQNFSDLSPVNLAYHESKNRFVNQFEEKQSNSPICMAGDTYINNSPRFDQYVDDYDIQT